MAIARYALLDCRAATMLAPGASFLDPSINFRLSRFERRQLSS